MLSLAAHCLGPFDKSLEDLECKYTEYLEVVAVTSRDVIARRDLQLRRVQEQEQAYNDKVAAFDAECLRKRRQMDTELNQNRHDFAAAEKRLARKSQAAETAKSAFEEAQANLLASAMAFGSLKRGASLSMPVPAPPVDPEQGLPHEDLSQEGGKEDEGGVSQGDSGVDG